MSSTSKIDMIGLKFGLLTVLSEVQERNKNGHILYNVICDCGKSKVVLGASLRSGKSKSCNKCTLLTGSHGMWNTKIFRVWNSMLHRCNPLYDKKYKNYAGKGIKVCERWINSFSNFYKDMGDIPSDNHSIERKDVNGDYCPENCKWASPKEQARNRTNNKRFIYKGEEKCASEWCELYSIPTSTFYNRLNRGWTIEDTLEKPIKIINK